MEFLYKIRVQLEAKFHFGNFLLIIVSNGTMQMMEELSEHVGMNYSEIPDSRYVAQPGDNFLFPCEEEGSVGNPITIEEDEGFSEPRTPVTEPPRQAPLMEATPVVRSIENLQNFESLAA